MPSELIDTSTDGDTLIAAPDPRMFIRIKGLDLTGAGDVTVTLKSNNTVIWKSYAASADGAGIVLDCSAVRDLDCAPGEALKIGLSAAVAVAGSVVYELKGQGSY